MANVTRLFFNERRLLVLMLIASLAAHVAAFYVFSVTDKVKLAGFGSRPHVGWMRPRALGATEMPLQYAIAEALDPSLMSLPSARGFSSRMWERGFVATHRAEIWSIEPAFLDVKVAESVPVFLPRAELAGLVQSAVQGYTPETEEPVEAVEPPVVINQSVVRFLGALQERAVVSPPVLPTLASVNPVRPTRIRIGVSGDGVVRYALLERPSGDDAVDARAMELVRQIQFEPVRDSDSTALAWGVVRFLWATEPPAPNGKPAGGVPR